MHLISQRYEPIGILLSFRSEASSTFFTSFFIAISTGKARVVVDICHGSQENRSHNTASTDI